MKLPNRSRQIAEEFEKRQQEQENKQQESKQQANREYLKSQIAEEETFFTLIRRLARENKLAVVSFL